MMHGHTQIKFTVTMLTSLLQLTDKMWPSFIWKPEHTLFILYYYERKNVISAKFWKIYSYNRLIFKLYLQNTYIYSMCILMDSAHKTTQVMKCCRLLQFLLFWMQSHVFSKSKVRLHFYRLLVVVHYSLASVPVHCLWFQKSSMFQELDLFVFRWYGGGHVLSRVCWKGAILNLWIIGPTFLPDNSNRSFPKQWGHFLVLFGSADDGPSAKASHICLGQVVLCRLWLHL
jgi:hypothetical protein